MNIQPAHGARLDSDLPIDPWPGLLRIAARVRVMAHARLTGALADLLMQGVVC